MRNLPKIEKGKKKSKEKETGRLLENRLQVGNDDDNDDGDGDDDDGDDNDNLMISTMMTHRRNAKRGATEAGSQRGAAVKILRRCLKRNMIRF